MNNDLLFHRRRSPGQPQSWSARIFMEARVMDDVDVERKIETMLREDLRRLQDCYSVACARHHRDARLLAGRDAEIAGLRAAVERLRIAVMDYMLALDNQDDAQNDESAPFDVLVAAAGRVRTKRADLLAAASLASRAGDGEGS